jgi:hypothetical protein
MCGVLRRWRAPHTREHLSLDPYGQPVRPARAASTLCTHDDSLAGEAYQDVAPGDTFLYVPHACHMTPTPWQRVRTHVWNTSRPVSQTSHQQPNHRYLDKGFAGLHLALIVNDQPPAAKQASERSFHNPLFWLLAPSTYSWRAFDDFEFPSTRGHAPVSQVLPLVGPVSPELRQSWDEVFQSSQKAACTKRIVHIGRSDVEGEGQTQCIYY